MHRRSCLKFAQTLFELRTRVKPMFLYCHRCLRAPRKRITQQRNLIVPGRLVISAHSPLAKWKRKEFQSTRFSISNAKWTTANEMYNTTTPSRSGSPLCAGRPPVPVVGRYKPLTLLLFRYVWIPIRFDLWVAFIKTSRNKNSYSSCPVMSLSSDGSGCQKYCQESSKKYTEILS